jgi:hypothetical protein
MAVKQSKSQLESEYAQIPVGPDHPLVMKGLREDNPRDFLAALGVLRLVDMLWPDHQPALSWNAYGHPVLYASRTLRDDWAAALAAAMQALNRQNPHPFVHNKVIKTEIGKLRRCIDLALDRRLSCSPLDRLPAALYAAYGSQVHDGEKGVSNPTAFSFSNGQGGKELLRDIAEMINEELTPANLLKDLTGSGSGRRDAKSFRWNPVELRAAAYRAHDPGSGVRGDVTLDYPCANIFAFIGLTYYPVIDASLREYTLGVSRIPLLGDCFTWPIWQCSLTSDVVFTMLHQSSVHSDTPDRNGGAALGIARAYRSQRMKVGKPPTISLYFSPAEAVF